MAHVAMPRYDRSVRTFGLDRRKNDVYSVTTSTAMAVINVDVSVGPFVGAGGRAGLYGRVSGAAWDVAVVAYATCPIRFRFDARLGFLHNSSLLPSLGTSSVCDGRQGDYITGVKWYNSVHCRYIDRINGASTI